MSKVFIVNAPARWNSGQQVMVPLDMAPAAEYGDLVYIFEGTHRPPSGEPAYEHIRTAMNDFTSDDYLVIVGDMDLVIWAAYVGLQVTDGKLRLLKWNNRTKAYDKVDAPPRYLLLDTVHHVLTYEATGETNG